MNAARKRKQTLTFLAFVFPALLFYAVFMLVPAGSALWFGMTNWNGLNTNNYKFIGMNNFIEALTDDPAFLNALLITLKYVLFMVIFRNLFAILLAVFIESRKRTRTLFRTILFMPNMLSMIVGGFVWMFIFTRVLSFIGEKTVLHFLNQSWIGDPEYSFIAILVVALWGGVGYLMVIYIAALQSVPIQMKESAEVDGANAFQTFWHITLPMILPAVTIGIFIALNNSFQVFDVVYSLTGGGPGRQTEVIALNIYEEAFNGSHRLGYGSAKAIILFLIIATVTLVQLWIMKRKEVEA